VSPNSARIPAAATTAPDVATTTLAAMLRRGEFEAVISANSALREPEATALKAVALAELGRLDEAIETIPSTAPLWRPGDPEEALQSDSSERTQIDRELDYSLVHHHAQATRFLAEANVLAGNHDAALQAWRSHWLPAVENQDALEQTVAIFERAIAIAPDRLAVYRAFAKLLFAFNEAEAALNPLARALAIDPMSRTTLRDVARAHNERRDFHHAMEACALLLEFEPDDAEALFLKAQALFELDEIGAAIADARRAISLHPTRARYRTLLGNLLKAHNQLDEAHEQFTKAVALDPAAVGAHSGIAMLDRFRADRSGTAAMKEVLSRANDRKSPLYVPLYHALGQQLEAAGRTAEAFESFALAAEIQRSRIAYNEAETLATVDRVEQIFDGNFLRKWRGVGNPSKRPIFIVGMLRSGSTLIEQIISSHPQVEGAGEVTFLSEAVDAHTAAKADLLPFPEMALGMDRDDFAGIAEDYLQKLTRSSKGTVRITDKYLSNALFAGLIHLCLPNARIIYARRDPVASCWSIFKTNFRRRPSFANDLGELGRYAARRERLMRHWLRVLPPHAIRTVRYETLVGDFETSVRELLRFLDLPWDDSCLAFDKSTRSVLTASVVQVRQPIYRSSVDGWRPFQAHLKPLIEALSVTLAP